jgi:acyl-CoA dehydrogenase
MAMQVRPVPTLDPRINDIRLRTAEILNEHVLPYEHELWPGRHGAPVGDAERRRAHERREEVKRVVWEAGLWAPHLPAEYGGMGLDFLAHAYMNEVLAYAMGGATLFGVVAPNSGNARLLLQYGTEEQKRRWLVPLVEGRFESGFSMTEPHNPGSDPRALDTTATWSGDHWVVNGHKWFTSNGIDADFFIVMCRVAGEGAPGSTDGVPAGGEAAAGAMVQLIVPTSTRGVDVVRGIGIWGRPESDHCEVVYRDVVVPAENTLGAPGQGHQAAQDRLGAGRVYHCMNSVGQMWRAFDMMVERADGRRVHGGLLKDKQFVQGFVADSYIDIQAARLMTIHAAEKVDRGDPSARVDISAIKVFVPAAYSRVVDRAIQVWGAAGITNDLPLAEMYQGARALRLADGPDEVHRILIARAVAHRFEKGEGWDFGN